MMTNLEEALQIHRQYLLETECPSNILKDSMLFPDEDDYLEDERGRTVGCRGITCEQCWNKEFYPEVEGD